MKIITWNCNMAFRKKAGLILAHRPDILIIPECEHPDKLVFTGEMAQPSDLLWYGRNPHKGLGIFSYNNYRFKVHRNYNSQIQLIVPIKVTGGSYDFNLLAIWAHNPADPDGPYVEQVWKAIHHYRKLLTNTHAVLAGDFNSNTIWDRKYRAGNHSNVVKYLESKGITSVYHLHHQQIQGKEQHPTYYQYRHRDKPYHLDYCFVSEGLVEKLQSVEIGDFDFWSGYSDHVPVIVNFHTSKLME